MNVEQAGVDRERILRRFEAWLDEALAAEQPPEGIAAELLPALESETEPVPAGRYDLHSMWAAMTALTQEVRLQGRSFKQLSETLAPVAELGPRVDSVLEAHSDLLAELGKEAQARTAAQVLDAMLDMRDRLGRGLESARRCSEQLLQPTWLDRLLTRPSKAVRHAREATAALEKGCQLSLDRLEEILAGFHVSEIACLNRPFDPRLMSAIDTEETDQRPEGTVLEVYRAGYEWNGEVYRTAQVKVARAPKAAANVSTVDDDGVLDE